MLSGERRENEVPWRGAHMFKDRYLQEGEDSASDCNQQAPSGLILDEISEEKPREPLVAEVDNGVVGPN